jgi:hypothetical protein
VNAELADKVLRLLQMPRSHEHLMRHLPEPVLARLLSAVISGRIRTTGPRDWLEVQQNSKSAWSLWGAFAGLLALTVLGAVVFASFWEIEVLRGAAHIYSPRAFSVACILLFCAGFAFSAYGLLTLESAKFPRLADGAIIAALCAMVVSILGDIALTCSVLSRWYGPAAALLALAAVVGFSVLLGRLAARRQRRYGNPLRRCFLASGRAFSDRTSVIAG